MRLANLYAVLIVHITMHDWVKLMTMNTTINKCGVGVAGYTPTQTLKSHRISMLVMCHISNISNINDIFNLLDGKKNR